MSITSVGTPATPTGGANQTSSPVTGNWGTGQNRASGNLLVALVTGFGSGGAGPTGEWPGTTGWAKQYEGNSAHCVAAIWTKAATGSDAAPAFDCGEAGSHASLMCALWELNDSGGSTPAVDTGGTATGTTSQSLTVTTAGTVTAGGEYALGCMTNGNTIVSSLITWSAPGGGWTKAFSGTSSNQYGGWDVVDQSAPSSGSALSWAQTYSYNSNSPTDQAGALIVVKPGAATTPTTTQYFIPASPPGLRSPAAWSGPASFAKQRHTPDPSLAPAKRVTGSGFLMFFP